MAKSPTLSVIIPSYNEQLNMQRGVLNDVLHYLESQPHTWELILSDDGSSDGTTGVLEAFAKQDARIKVLPNPHAGKGPTVQAGMLAATGEWRLFTDFDQSTPLVEVEKLLHLGMEEGYQVIIGSREIAGARRDDEPLYRHLMGRCFNILVQTLAVPGITDTQCGFKLFSAKAAKALFGNLKVYGFEKSRLDAFTGAFDVEILFLARKFHYSIKEVPVIWHHHETDRVSPVKDSVRMLKDIIKVRIADLQRRYA